MQPGDVAVRLHPANPALHFGDAPSARMGRSAPGLSGWPRGGVHCPGVAENADLTGLLQRWGRGDVEALDEFARLVHQELRAMARRLLRDEGRHDRLQPTELVQESYLRLLDWRAVQWQSRAHFFSAAAGMMRRVLVDIARARRAQKRGAGADPVPLDEAIAANQPPVDLVALADALDRLAAIDPRPAKVVEMRFFGGFTVEETADALGISVRTVIYDWNTARAWLRRALGRKDPA